MSRHRVLVASSLGLLLVLAVAGVSLLGKSGASTSNETGQAGTAGQVIAPVELTSLDGGRLALPDGRPGALFFSASSCVSCIPAAKALGELKRGLGDRVDAVFISIDPGDPPAALAERRESVGSPPYPFAIDTTGLLAGQYGITALGTVLIYDAEGTIADRLIEPDLGQLKGAFASAGVS